MGYCPAIPSISSTAFLTLYIKYFDFGSFFQEIVVAQEIIKMTDLDSNILLLVLEWKRCSEVEWVEGRLSNQICYAVVRSM